MKESGGDENGRLSENEGFRKGLQKGIRNIFRKK